MSHVPFKSFDSCVRIFWFSSFQMNQVIQFTLIWKINSQGKLICFWSSDHWLNDSIILFYCLLEGKQSVLIWVFLTSSYQTSEDLEDSVWTTFFDSFASFLKLEHLSTLIVQMRGFSEHVAPPSSHVVWAQSPGWQGGKSPYHPTNTDACFALGVVLLFSLLFYAPQEFLRNPPFHISSAL